MTPKKSKTCDHGVTFDEAAAKKLLDAAPLPKNVGDFILGNSNSVEVRKRWPRGFFSADKPCPKGCGFVGVYYASQMHYMMSDW